MKYGVGGFNIDECRIPYQTDDKLSDGYGGMSIGIGKLLEHQKYEGCREANDKGRYPPNLLCQDNVLDDGEKRNQGHWAKSKVVGYGKFGGGTSEYFGVGEKDKPSSLNRFFDLDAWWNERIKKLPKNVQRTFPFMFCPKASKKEKEEGIENENIRECRWNNAGKWQNLKTEYKNIHPTVKPIKICSWLTILCTKEGATVLDPFMGSGTQGVACLISNRKFIGIEKEEEYFNIAKARIAEQAKQERLFRE